MMSRWLMMMTRQHNITHTRSMHTHNGIALMSIAAATWLTIVSCVIPVHICWFWVRNAHKQCEQKDTLARMADGRTVRWPEVEYISCHVPFIFWIKKPVFDESKYARNIWCASNSSIAILLIYSNSLVSSDKPFGVKMEARNRRNDLNGKYNTVSLVNRWKMSAEQPFGRINALQNTINTIWPSIEQSLESRYQPSTVQMRWSEQNTNTMESTVEANKINTHRWAVHAECQTRFSMNLSWVNLTVLWSSTIFYLLILMLMLADGNANGPTNFHYFSSFFFSEKKAGSRISIARCVRYSCTLYNTQRCTIDLTKYWIDETGILPTVDKANVREKKIETFSFDGADNK